MEPVLPPLSADAAFANPNSVPLTVPALIAGRPTHLSTTFDVVSPYTSTLAWRCSSATPADATLACDAAASAFPIWSATKPAERRKILMKAADLMEERGQEIAAAMRTEMGAGVGASEGFILPSGVARLREIAGLASMVAEGSGVPATGVEGQSAMVVRVPVGVVVGIVPWNAPPVFANRSIGYALAAGCTTVIKASEITPRTYQLLAQCYLDAGLPPGTLNLLSCPPTSSIAVTNALITHPAVRKINFTGSTSVGRAIAIACARELKPCLLELGGKNSAIVLEDADLELAAEQCVLGAFLNGGQICMSTDRILVHEKVAGEFRRRFAEALGRFFPKNNPPPTLCSKEARERVLRVVGEAVRAGAKVVKGPWESEEGEDGSEGAGSGDVTTAAASKTDSPSNPGQHTNKTNTASSKGTFLRPIVLDQIPADSSVLDEEFFASLVAITTFSPSSSADPDSEPINLANSTGYGLSASVFTRDLRRGFSVARRLEAGMVHVNRMTVQDDPELPFGGVKDSGWGRFNGTDGLGEFLVSKVVTWMD